MEMRGDFEVSYHSVLGFGFKWVGCTNVMHAIKLGGGWRNEKILMKCIYS